MQFSLDLSSLLGRSFGPSLQALPTLCSCCRWGLGCCSQRCQWEQLGCPTPNLLWRSLDRCQARNSDPTDPHSHSLREVSWQFLRCFSVYRMISHHLLKLSTSHAFLDSFHNSHLFQVVWAWSTRVWSRRMSMLAETLHPFQTAAKIRTAVKGRGPDFHNFQSAVCMFTFKCW